MSRLMRGSPSTSRPGTSHVLGFAANEQRRIDRDRAIDRHGRRPDYPLHWWNWTRDISARLPGRTSRLDRPLERTPHFSRGRVAAGARRATAHHDRETPAPRPTRPAAEEVASRLANFERKVAYVGSVVTDPKRLALIMRRNDPNVYLGKFVTCVFNPDRALRRRQLRPEGPDLNNCQPLRCRNVALTAENRQALVDRLGRLDELLSNADAIAPYVVDRLNQQRQDLLTLLSAPDTSHHYRRTDEPSRAACRRRGPDGSGATTHRPSERRRLPQRHRARQPVQRQPNNLLPALRRDH
ncbi:hypothetical protein [Dactylosporangium sp. NPDC000521]|uniref:hypothetical protein n=1 Tax=Dactylosporangium sp. NPDC000521 TaxID=3363975 RepID=UPI00367DE277